VAESPWRPQIDALGEFIRAQRRRANLSLRELASLTRLSNAYLSQLERGQHEPSVRVLRALSAALDVSVDTLLAQAGLFAEDAGGEARGHRATEAAIRADPRLTDDQKEALLAVYRTLVAER
jgi:transcriptional regulator with XRE-family HTH domain